MIHVNKERLGDFIGSERKNLGLTQRDLAARLHVTDKAVSKWERGLSYPDVTLLEPLAAALDLTVEELMACRRQAAKGAEETMQSLLDISRDSVRQERRRSWQRLAAVLVLLAVTAAVVAYTQIVVTEEGYYSIVLKETVNGRNCVYVEDRGHLIRLKCGEDVDFDALTLRDERGDTISYQMDFQWNRLTRTGTVSACEDTGVTVLGGVMDVTYEGDSGSVPLLFGYTSVQYLRDGYYPDPYAESENLVFLCDVRFWPYHPEEPDPTGINTRANPGSGGLHQRRGAGRGWGRSAGGGRPHPLAGEAVHRLRLCGWRDCGVMAGHPAGGDFGTDEGPWEGL